MSLGGWGAVALLYWAAAQPGPDLGDRPRDLPYDRLLTQGTRQPQHWNERCLAYQVGAAGSAQTPGDSEFAAIELAFESWRAAAQDCGNGWSFAAGPMLRPEDYRVGYEPGVPNTNVVLFREVSCADVVPADDPCRSDDETAKVRCANAYHCWWAKDLALATTLNTYVPEDGQILDADIQLNASPPSRTLANGRRFTATNGPVCSSERSVEDGCVGYDIQNTLTHEIGHALGFAHVASSSSTMAEHAVFGETSKRVIDVATLDGLCTVYPGANPPKQCESTARSLGLVVANAPVSGGCTSATGLREVTALLTLLWTLRRRRAPPKAEAAAMKAR